MVTFRGLNDQQVRAGRRTLNVIFTAVVDLLVSFILVIDTITRGAKSFFYRDIVVVLWGLL
jgi:hypothetical protein